MDEAEAHDARFDAMVLANAPLERLAEGFRWLEGPVWFGDHGCLLFSDVPNNRIMRWTEEGVSLFRAPSHFSNGQTRDRQGRLVTCCHQTGCVVRTEFDGAITILAQSFDGRPLNAPNDVIVKSDDSIWFTDPHYGINTDYEGGKRHAQLPARLYRLDSDGRIAIAADDFDGPNGLCFSPDESRLYVTETGHQFAAEPRRYIRVFEVAGGGARLTAGRMFHKVEPGYADGIRCDEHGNLWASAGDGVHCIGPEGALLGKILVPAPVSNIAFGGRNRSRLFICAGQTLYAIFTNVRGAARP